jgi:hypothetical protein
VARLAASFEVRDRYEKTVAFRQYLERQWFLANIDATYFDFASLMQSHASTFQSVKLFLGGGRRPSGNRREHPQRTAHGVRR